MLKVSLASGKEIEFEEFPIKDSNMRKVNITSDGEDSEGVWAVFNDADLVKYDNDTKSEDYEAVVILVNSPLNFFPMNGWGAYVPVKFNGSTRASMDTADMAGSMVFCKERRDGEAAAAAKQKANGGAKEKEKQ